MSTCIVYIIYNCQLKKNGQLKICKLSFIRGPYLGLQPRRQALSEL